MRSTTSHPGFITLIATLALACTDPPQDPEGIPIGEADSGPGLPPVLGNGGQGGGPGGGQGGMPGGGQGGQGGNPQVGQGGQGGQGGSGRPPVDDGWCDPSWDEVCGDDLDNNCDGLVDEGCSCQAPEKPCYPGNPADLEVANGACREGTQACRLEFYGPCEGAITPQPEVCDGIDNDCNGEVDDLPGCDTTPPVAICPPEQFGPPLANYTFEGGYEHPEGVPMARATWTILSQPAGSTSEPMPADALRTVIFADLQGEYVLQLEVADTNGAVARCETKLTTETRDQLRIEMVWNVNAQNDPSDVDMHLLRGPGARWFDDDRDGDDCFFANCSFCQGRTEAQCRQELSNINAGGGSPPPQVMWSQPLDEDDPRLDLDDVEGNGPENINILEPRNDTYRLGVHYWDDDGFGPSTVSVRIFCGGELAKEFEPIIMNSTGSFGDPNTEFWEVADIVWNGDGCEVRELGTPECRQICNRGQAEFGGCPQGMMRGRACN